MYVGMILVLSLVLQELSIATYTVLTLKNQIAHYLNLPFFTFTLNLLNVLYVSNTAHPFNYLIKKTVNGGWIKLNIHFDFLPRYLLKNNSKFKQK